MTSRPRPEEPDTLMLVAGEVVAEIDQAAGSRLRSLRIGGLEVLGGAGDRVYEWGSFVMAPYAGRVGGARLGFRGQSVPLPVVEAGNAMHGLVHERPWTVQELATDGVLLRTAFDSRWPFGGYVDHLIALSPDGVTFTITVTSDGPEFPATVGWHPWFRRRLATGHPVELSMTARAMLHRGPDGLPDGTELPVGPGPWDDCFVDPAWPVRLTWPGALQLAVGSDTRFAVVFDQRAEAVCVEPQTGPPAAVDDHGPGGAAIVTTGEPLTATMTWSWS